MKLSTVKFLFVIPLLIPTFLPGQGSSLSDQMSKARASLRKRLTPVIEKLPKASPDQLEGFLKSVAKASKLSESKIPEDMPEETRIKIQEVANMPFSMINKALCNPELPWKVDHYLVATNYYLKASNPGPIVKIGEAGLKRFPDSRFLLDNTGLGYLLKYMNSKGKGRTALEKSFSLFQKAVTLKPDTFHAYNGLYQAAERLGKYVEALQAWEKLVTFKEAGRLFANPCLREGRLRLGIGDFSGAAKILDREKSLAQDPGNAILAMRARALEGDLLRAQEIAAQFPIKGMEGRIGKWARADLMIFRGKTRDAKKYLKANPVKRFGGEPESHFKLSEHAQAALQLMATMKPRSYSRILKRFPEALNHKFIIFAADKKGKPKEICLNNSPLAMGALLLSCPDSPKTGGNKIFLALASFALQTYKLKKIEKEYLPKSFFERKGLQKLQTPAGLDVCLKALELGVGTPDFLGALVGWKLVQDLRKRMIALEKRRKRKK